MINRVSGVNQMPAFKAVIASKYELDSAVKEARALFGLPEKGVDVPENMDGKNYTMNGNPDALNDYYIRFGEMRETGGKDEQTGKPIKAEFMGSRQKDDFLGELQAHRVLSAMYIPNKMIQSKVAEAHA